MVTKDYSSFGRIYIENIYIYPPMTIHVKDAYEVLAIYIYIYIREGNGTPLQHSCLENLMDGGAW